MEDLRKEFNDKIHEAGITAKALCEDVGYSEQALYTALRKNHMVKRTYNLLMNRLQEIIEDKQGLDKKDTKESKETKTTIVESDSFLDVNYWRRKYEESQQTNRILVNTIEKLTMGKYNPVFQSQTAAA